MEHIDLGIALVLHLGIDYIDLNFSLKNLLTHTHDFYTSTKIYPHFANMLYI